MDDNLDGGNNISGHPKFSPLEEECIDLIESIPDSDPTLEDERSQYEHKLWITFQNSALAISQLYRDNPASNTTSTSHHWNSFQSASTNLALLYKDCADFQKKMNDYHYQHGQNKRNKELIHWAKMKKNHIRRDELIAFISGRPYTPAGHVSGLYTKINRSRNASRGSRFYPLDTGSLELRATSPNDEVNLNTFREALVNGRFRNQRSPPRNETRNNNNNDDLNEFFNQEYYRHVESRKRHSQNMDVCMDSPTNKRTRFG